MAETDDDPTLEELAAALDRAEVEEVALALAAALQVAWEQQVEAALTVAVQQDVRTVSALLQVMSQQLSAPLRSAARPRIRTAVESIYVIGRNETGAGPVGAPGQRSVQFMDDYGTFWVENHFDRFTRRRIQSVSDDAVQDGLGAFRSGQRFANSRLGGAFSKSQSYWELLSNATATRTRELAHIDGYASQGIEEVFIDAVLDARTSCICRTLNGTRLPVEGLVGHKQDLMDTGSPEEVKEVSPWLKCSRIRTLEAQGPQALLDAGIASPPYHGHCRSRLSVPLD